MTFCGVHGTFWVKIFHIPGCSGLQLSHFWVTFGDFLSYPGVNQGC